MRALCLGHLRAALQFDGTEHSCIRTGVYPYEYGDHGSVGELIDVTFYECNAMTYSFPRFQRNVRRLHRHVLDSVHETPMALGWFAEHFLWRFGLPDVVYSRRS